MPSIRRPEAALRGGYADHRIEERPGLFDNRREFLVVGFSEISLKWCRLDAIDRHDRNHKRRPAERVAARSNNTSAVSLDSGYNLTNVCGGSIQAALYRFQSLRFRRCL